MLKEFLAARQRKRLRRRDLQTIWPALCNQGSLYRAKVAFMDHCANNPAWTTEYAAPELRDFVGRLKAESRV